MRVYAAQVVGVRAVFEVLKPVGPLDDLARSPAVPVSPLAHAQRGPLAGKAVPELLAGALLKLPRHNAISLFPLMLHFFIYARQEGHERSFALISRVKRKAGLNSFIESVVESMLPKLISLSELLPDVAKAVFLAGEVEVIFCQGVGLADILTLVDQISLQANVVGALQRNRFARLA